MFDNLLISSPNNGGLFYVNGDCVAKVDNFDTTGLCFAEERIVRGIQPRNLLKGGKLTRKRKGSKRRKTKKQKGKKIRTKKSKCKGSK